MDTPKRSHARHPRLILAVILVTTFMTLLDNSIVFTGVPIIRSDLGFSGAGVAWVSDAYSLVFGGLLLLAARCGDVIGRRRLFIIGISIFSAASLIIGLAPTAGVLVGARALQGVGAAILAPTTLSLLTANFPAGSPRTRALAAYGSMAGIGGSVGLVLGGAVADLASWRVGFLINVPVGVLVIVGAVRYLHETPRLPGRIDVPGALTSTAGMTALVYGIIHSASSGWRSAPTVIAIAAGVVLFAAFVIIEARTREPLLPLRIFRNRTRAGAFITRVLFAGAIFGYFLYVSLYLQDALGFTPLVAGLAFMPMTVVNFFVALAVPRLTARHGNSVLVMTGVAVTLAGMFWLSRLDGGSTYWANVAMPMVIIGIGQGLGFAPLTAAAIVDVSSRDESPAAGLVNAAHQVGTALGISIMAAVAATGTGAASNVVAAAERSSHALTVGSVLLALAVITSMTLIREPRPHRDTAPTT